VALDRWCAAVGPAVTMNHGDHGDGVDSIAVISWNTHVGGADIVGLVEDLRAGAFTRGEPVRHFVLLLQEVYRAGADVPRRPDAPAPRRIAPAPPGGAPRFDIVETARRLGLELYYAPSMANGRASPDWAEDRGNAILSTIALTDLAAIELPFEAQRRVAAAATLRGVTTSGRPWRLAVASVHFDHRSRPSRLLASLGAGRRRQAVALLDALDAADACVIGGDLNTWSLQSLEGAVPALERVFVTPAGLGAQPTFATPWGFHRRLDRLLFRVPDGQAARARRLNDRRGSDHHPLLGWVRLDS
jgi:endonuclease/exonuclease/phosphatase family metal-dependent hydrolase